MKSKITLLLLLLVQMGFSQKSGYYTETYRPQFHFTPEAKWMNDPNGLIYLNGKYHLFYQYHPESTVWGPMHWGHAESADLLHWKHLPIALYPDKLGMIFSGSAVVDKGNTAGFGKNALIAIFTYHNDEIWKAGKKNTESQALAYSLDEGKTWTKHKGNPVLNNSGEQDFRDPKVFWDESSLKWIMVLAAGDKIKIFSSPNIKDWAFESDFQPDDLPDLGVWECPDLFPMKIKSTGETKWVMIVNHGDKAPNGGSGTRYFVGNFDGKTFTENQKSIWLDKGTDFYAAVTFSNVPNDKRILLGWMSNWQYAPKVPTEAWRSAMTLPRELELTTNGYFFRLEQKIIPQFSTLLTSAFEQKEVKAPYKKDGLNLAQAEVSFETQNITDAIISLSNTKGEVFTITLSGGMLVTDRSNSGKKEFSEKFAEKQQVMPIGEKVTDMRFILDKSSIEILINNGRYSMTNLFFPNEDYSILSIITKDNKPVQHLKISSVKSVWR